MEYRKIWRGVPTPVRKLIVMVIGFTLIAIGGVFILAIEFTWARLLLTKAQESAKKIDPRKLKKRKPKGDQ